MIPNPGNKIGMQYIGQNLISLESLMWVIRLQNSPGTDSKKTQYESEMGKEQEISFFLVWFLLP